MYSQLWSEIFHSTEKQQDRTEAYRWTRLPSLSLSAGWKAFRLTQKTTKWGLKANEEPSVSSVKEEGRK